MTDLSQQVFHRAKSAAFTEVQHHDVSAQVLEQAQKMRTDNNGRASLSAVAEALLSQLKNGRGRGRRASAAGASGAQARAPEVK